MKNKTNDQVAHPSPALPHYMRTGPVLLMSAILMASGCRSVSTEQSHREMETTATAAISGIASLPRQSPHDSVPGMRVQDLLADDLTAEDAVRIALWNNRRIQADYERLDMAAADRLTARLLKNPEVDGALIRSTKGSSEEIIELGAEIDLLHMILLPKRKRVGAANYEAVKLDVAQAVQELAYDTRVACYRLLAARQRLSMRTSVLEAAEAARDMARRLREAGNIRELDRLNWEALYEQAALEVSAAELAVAKSREDLHVLMGLTGDDTSWRMAGELPHPSGNEPSADVVVTLALQNSVQLAMTRWDIEAAAQTLGIARTKSVIPSLHVGIDAERARDGVWFVGPRLAVELPLFDFGQTRRPAAEAALRRLRHEYAAQAVEIAAAARTAALRATVSAVRVRHYREKVLPLRRQITEQTQLQYNAMQLGVFQLLQAKQMELGAESAYIDELLNYWIARIDLEQIRSGLLVQMGRPMLSSPTVMPIGGAGNGGH